MFTYDLVANPGFSNAELKRVNESYGFGSDDNLGIFEVPEFWKIQGEVTNETTITENKTKQEMDSSKYISLEDFNQYTKIVKNEFNELKKSLQESTTKSDDKDVNEGIVRYAEAIAKKVNSLQENIGRLTENIDGLISHNDYIVENLEKVKKLCRIGWRKI